MANDFRARLKRGDRLLGTMVTLPSPPSAEVLASLGFDWLFVDAEHGPLETAELLGILTAVNRRAACLVRVPGVDAVLLGPYDLSASLGKMGQVDDPEVVAAIARVTDACRGAGMPLGYFGVSAAAVRPYAERGYTLIVAGVDTTLLAGAARGLLAELRG